MGKVTKSHLRAIVLASCAVSLALPVSAQELEEIVVVARKREESLQEVPISIATFSAEDIAAQGIDSLEDIARQTAGVIFDRGFSPQDTRVVMRGLSPSRGRPNVAVLLDDVGISSESIRTAGSSLSVNPRLIDIERIEVVRGPQSALYGRSAFGGAIHYVTRRPGAERRGQLSVDVSAEGKREILRGHLRAEFDFSGAMLTSITHFGKVEATQFHDSQRSGDISRPVPPFGISTSGEVYFGTETDLFSQEFRLSSTGEGAVSWVLGALLWKEETQHDDYSRTCILWGFIPPFVSDFSLPRECGYWVARIGSEVPRNNQPWNRDVSHTWAYGRLEWQFSEQWDLSF